MYCEKCGDVTRVISTRPSGQTSNYWRILKDIEYCQDVVSGWANTFVVRNRECNGCKATFATAEVLCKDLELQKDLLAQTEGWFVAMMQNRLSSDFKATRWDEKTEKQILERAKDAFLDLARCVKGFHPKKDVIRNCASVANHIMMIALTANNLMQKNGGKYEGF